jgi:HSP20 family protein
MANLIRRTEGGVLEPTRMLDPIDVMREFMQWDPFREMTTLGVRNPAFVPAFEVKETKDGFVFKADLPGIQEKDLDVSLTGNRLTVSGKREEETRREEERFFALERSYGSFSRSFTLPDGVDPDSAQAEMKDGVLTLRLAKKPEVKARKIELKPAKAEEKGKAHA